MKSIGLSLIAVALALSASEPGVAQRVDLYGDPLPVGAIARLGTVRFRHPGWHKRIAFLPDGKTLIVGTSDNTVRSWNARTGKLIHELDLGGAQLRSHCLSADGRSVATLSWQREPQSRETRHRLSIWHAVTWRELQHFTWTEQLGGQNVQHIAFSPDKRLIAGGAMDGTVRMCDAETGEVKTNRNVVRGDVLALAFSPRQELIAVAGMDGVMLWEYPTDNPPQSLPKSLDRPQSVCFSHDGKLLAVGGDGSRAPQLFDVAARRLAVQLAGESEGYYPEGLFFSADDRRLIVPADRNHCIEIFDVDSGKLVKKLEAGRVKPRDVAASPDGRLVAAVASESAFIVWDAATGQRLSDKYQGHLETPYEIEFTPDGQRVVTGCLDGTIRIWDAGTGKQQRVLEHEHWVAAIALSPGGRRIVSCGLDDTVRLWDADSGEEIYRLPGHGRSGGSITTEVAFSPDGERFLSFGGDMYLRAYSVATGRALEEHFVRPADVEIVEDEDGLPRAKADDPFGAPGGAIGFSQARFTPDATKLLLMRDSIHVFDVANGKELDVIKSDMPWGGDFFFTADGKFLATLEQALAAEQAQAGMRARVPILRLRDWKTRNVVREVALAGDYARSLAISPSGKLIAVSVTSHDASAGPTPTRWIDVLDAETLQTTARIVDDSSSFNHLAFSPDDLRLAAGNADSTVTVWDLRQFQTAAAP